MAKVAFIGGLVEVSPNQALASQGVSEVFSGNIFRVVVAGIGGLASPLLPKPIAAQHALPVGATLRRYSFR